MARDIAVIGAGLSGLTAAQSLRGRGHNVSIFDKSRGLGGRIATRRVNGVSINHGAAAVLAKTPAFEEFLMRAGAEREPLGGWVCRSGMSSIVRTLSGGLSVFGNRRVTKISDAADGLHLDFEDGTNSRPFEHVLLTVPAPQARSLLADFPAEEAMLSVVEMAPVWTFMAAFSEKLPVPDRLSGPAFRRLARQINDVDTPDIWVGHASLTWSAAYLEMPVALVETSLQASFAAALGRLPPVPIYRAVHRWRYAFATQPLGAPYLAALDGRILIGGDWALGGGAEDAWTSGRAMAAAIG